MSSGKSIVAILAAILMLALIAERLIRVHIVDNAKPTLVQRLKSISVATEGTVSGVLLCITYIYAFVSHPAKTLIRKIPIRNIYPLDLRIFAYAGP